MHCHNTFNIKISIRFLFSNLTLYTKSGKMKAAPVWTNSLATQFLTDFSKKQVTEILKFLVLQMRLTCWQYTIGNQVSQNSTIKTGRRISIHRTFFKMVSDPPSKRCLLGKNKHTGNVNILGFGFMGFFNLSQKKEKEQMKCYGEWSFQCISPSPTQGGKVKLSRFYVAPAEDLWIPKKPRT